MPTTVTILFFLFWVCFAARYRLCGACNITFLELIARYPDRAYDWFIAEQCWLVVDPDAAAPAKEPEALKLKEYTAPFTLIVPKLNGKVVTVYGRLAEFEDSAKRFVECYGRRRKT